MDVEDEGFEEVSLAAELKELPDEDARFILQHLLEVVKPFLEQDLKRASSPDELIKEEEQNPPNCDEEFNQASRIFEKFFTEEVAVRSLPPDVREQLGPAERWRWCIMHVRCCLIFGWLVCRGPRTFRSLVYYLYRYWICVRQALGTPVSHPLTKEQRRDLETLVKAVAAAYRPYLADQMQDLDFSNGIPDELLSGQIDCNEGIEESQAIFERLLTQDNARALFGAEAFGKYSKDPFFWLCRCWCLCAIRFGCCLSRSRNLVEAFRCLRVYLRCIRFCFQRLHCKLTSPTGCVQGETDILAGRILEPITGEAFGLSFSHYIIEIYDPAANLLSGVVIYPNSSGNPDPSLTQGSIAVSSGTLGWIDVKKAATDAGVELLTSTTFSITLRIFSTGGGELSPPCTSLFDLSVNEVYIKQVSTPWSVNFTDENEPLRVANNSAAALATVGGALHVRGAANIFGCAGENVKEYTIWAIPDNNFTFAQPAPFTAVSPAPGWVQLTHIDFTSQTIDGTTYTADQVRSYNILDGDPDPDILTNVWGTRSECICVHVDATLLCTCHNIPSLQPGAFNSNILPKLNPALHEGGTGKFTFLLQLIDTAGNEYYDVQRVWVDNEPIKAAITGIAGLAPCADLYTKNANGAFKTVDVRGTAWDQLIEPGNLVQPTSDNFDQYTVHFQKQGAAGYALLASSSTPIPPRPMPLGTGTLTAWNLQTVDAASNPLGLPADQLLGPGQECTYNVILQVWDKTVVNEGTVHYSGFVLFPIKIINGQEPGP